MNKKFLLITILSLVWFMQASQWEKISIFLHNECIGYVAQSVDNNQSLLIVCFGPGNYSGVKKVGKTVYPIDQQGHLALKQQFNELKEAFQKKEQAKLSKAAHL